LARMESLSSWARRTLLQERLADAVNHAYETSSAGSVQHTYAAVVAFLSAFAKNGPPAPVVVGSRIPSVQVGSKPALAPPKQVDIASHVAGKKVILLGLPGAFTAC